MQYLLLIYENEQRWNQGYMQDELAEYQAFGKEFAVAIRGKRATANQHRFHRPRARRQTLDHRWAVRRDQGAAWRVLFS